jgi:hypothetical protein
MRGDGRDAVFLPISNSHKIYYGTYIYGDALPPLTMEHGPVAMFNLSRLCG